MEPLLSVSLDTYNHEKLIGQAIESVLAQKVNFHFELVIGEDFSTDDTRKICLSYQEKYPGKIKLLFRDKNIGMMRNYIETMQACKGKYIALIDGDDYWIDPHKLQKQVDFLESHADFAICFHDIVKCWDDGNGSIQMGQAPNIEREISTFEDLCKEGCFMQTTSVVFRNGPFIQNFPDWYYNAPYFDWALYLFAAEHGKIKNIKEAMSAHRVHSGGITSSKYKGNAYGKPQLKIIKLLDQHYKHKYKKYFYTKARIELYTTMALLDSRESKKMLQSWYYAYKLILLTGRDYKINPKNIKKLFGALYRTIFLKNTPLNQVE